MTAARIRRSVALLAGAVLLSAGLAVPAPAFGVRTLGISAPSFDFSLSPGGTGKGDLQVLNEGTEPVDVLVYAAEQKIDASGTATYVVPDRNSATSASAGASSWISLKLPPDAKTAGNVPYVSIKPGGSAPVKFDFQVPANASPGDHQVILFFEMFSRPNNGEGAVMAVSGRLGSRVRIRVKGEFVEKVEVAPFSVRSFVIGSKVPYSFTVKNSGNLDERVTAGVEVLDSSEAIVGKASPLSDLPIYASTSKKVAGEIDAPNLGFGQNIVRLTASYKKQGASQPETVVKERTLFAVPLWFVIAVVALVATLLTGTIVWVARRRARRKKASAAQTEPAAA